MENLAIAAILVTTGFELFILRNYNDQIGAGWSIGVGVIGAVAAIALFVFKQRQNRSVTMFHLQPFSS